MSDQNRLKVRARYHTIFIRLEYSDAVLGAMGLGDAALSFEEALAAAWLKGYEVRNEEIANPSDEAPRIPARPYPGDEAAVKRYGVSLPFCNCGTSSIDDNHTPACKFWNVVLSVRRRWHDENVAAWSCGAEARGLEKCAYWCGHIGMCPAYGTDRRAVVLTGSKR